MYKRQSGFTLIEIAIVLVIIGLLLGGVLKGQELITGARVRNLIAQQDGVKAAYFGFLDRYRALPGDYSAATTNISNISTAACNGGNGNGNGQIQTGTVASPTAVNENLLAWEHLSKGGFINGSYTCAAAASSATSPSNPYGGILDLAFDALFANQGGSRHNLKTGRSLPSDILAEVDRKVDDGNPSQGSFRAEPVDGGGSTCVSGTAPNFTWVTSSPGTTCGGTTLF